MRDMGKVSAGERSVMGGLLMNVSSKPCLLLIVHYNNIIPELLTVGLP